jgi:hypothetical protein
MMKPISKYELNVMGCGTPNCGHDHSILYLHAQCHPRSATWIRYEKIPEVLVITCAKCDKEVARIRLSVLDSAH